MDWAVRGRFFKGSSDALEIRDLFFQREDEEKFYTALDEVGSPRAARRIWFVGFERAPGPANRPVP